MRPVNQPPVPPLPPAPNAAGHLALPLLRQYVAGTLPAAEQHRVEAHTLSCARCAEILEGLELTDPATTDAALHQLQLRLHQRVAQAEAPRRAFQMWQAAAAMLLLLLVSTAVWWGLRRPAAVPESAPVAMQVPAAPAPPSESAASAAETEAQTDAAPSREAPSAVAAAPPVAAETTDAIAAATPGKRPAGYRLAARAPRRKPPVLIAANPPATETMSVTVADAAADEAPAGALTAPAAAPVARQQASAAIAESKAAADTLPMLAAAPAKSKRATVAEEGAARKAALPPAPTVSPQPAGGYLRLREYLRREGMFVPPAPARQLSGSVRVKFTVTAAGKLENFQILRSLRADYDSEAIRLLCEGPTWQPGAANGRRADQVVEINISF